MHKSEYKIKLSDDEIERFGVIAAQLEQCAKDDVTLSLAEYLNYLCVDSNRQEANMGTLRRRCARKMHRLVKASGVLEFVNALKRVGAINATMAVAITEDLYFLDSRLYRECNKNYSH